MPEGSRYVRTGTLLGSWETNVVSTGSNISATIHIRAPYAKWVQGAEQRPYHAQHGWKRLQDYTDRKGFSDGVQKALGGIKFGRG